jgi:hypothetical protein
MRLLVVSSFLNTFWIKMLLLIVLRGNCLVLFTFSCGHQRLEQIQLGALVVAR